MRNIVVKKDQEKVLPYIWIDGEDKEFDVIVDLQGNASLHILGIFLGTKNHSVKFDTRVIHKGKHTKSRMTIRGVFFDQSTFSNDGLVRIEKGAKGADGYFASKILLFDNAKGRSVPSLEIDENDLKAGHASTVGRPDEDQLFYMRSRGISEKDAEKLIVSGFFEPVLALLPERQQKEVRRKIEDAIR